MESINSPNLFTCTTNSIAQRVFICWFLEWANPKYKPEDEALYKVSQEFLKKIFSWHGVKLKTIKSVHVENHEASSVVGAIINEQYYLYIVDSIEVQYSSQLDEIYYQAKEKYSNLKLIPMYFKNGDLEDSFGERALDLGEFYQYFMSQQFMSILKHYHGNSSAVVSFRSHLKGLREGLFLSKRVDEWSRHQLTSFYQRLKHKLEEGDFKAILTPSVDVFWWGIKTNVEPCPIKLQIDYYLDRRKKERKLCLKVTVEDAEKRRAYRDEWLQRIDDVGLLEMFDKPKKYKSGRIMTVGVFKDEFLVVDDNGLIDVDRTVLKLKGIQNLLEKF